MTGPGDVSRETSTAWQQYLNREHAARDQYLATTQAAHREYLAGPWPDRGYYLTVERDAYTTYYAAGRRAWQNYRDAMDTLPPDIVAPGPAATAARDEWLARNPKQPNKPPQASHPYPLPDRGSNYAALNHGQATFTAYPADPPFCGATPDGASWPVCALRPHTGGDHESADYHWADGDPASLKESGQ